MRRRLSLLIATALVLVSLHWLVFQGVERVPGVVARPLGPCDIDWFRARGGLLVLGCPRVDSIKFWPLPIEYPWFEDDPPFGLPTVGNLVG
jgi:hypothetical protein